MKYILEFVDRNGTLLSDEEHSQLESDIPIPIPNVGDKIYLPKENDQSAICVEVVNREFHFWFAGKQHDLTAQIQVFCKVSIGSH